MRLLLVLAGMAVLLCGAGGATAASCCAHASAGDEALSDASLYQAGSIWTNQAGDQVRFADLKGRPRLVTMFFASCTYACPRIAADIVKFTSSLAPAERDALGVVMVSLDPARDSPAALADFASRNHLSKLDPILLTGSPSSVRELAALLGVRYRTEANGDIAHSTKLVLLDAGGVAVAEVEGLGADAAPLAEALRELTGSDR